MKRFILVEFAESSAESASAALTAVLQLTTEQFSIEVLSEDQLINRFVDLSDSDGHATTEDSVAPARQSHPASEVLKAIADGYNIQESSPNADGSLDWYDVDADGVLIGIGEWGFDPSSFRVKSDDQ